MGERNGERMGGYRRKPISDTVHREVWRVQDTGNKMIETRERLARRNKLKEKEHLEVHGRFRTRYMDENVFTRPNGLRENLKLPFRVGDLDLPERKKKVHQ